jgi:hypothetical protein
VCEFRTEKCQFKTEKCQFLRMTHTRRAASALRSVDLPRPLRPIRPYRLPGTSSRLTWCVSPGKGDIRVRGEIVGEILPRSISIMCMGDRSAAAAVCPRRPVGIYHS